MKSDNDANTSVFCEVETDNIAPTALELKLGQYFEHPEESIDFAAHLTGYITRISHPTVKDGSMLRHFVSITKSNETGQLFYYDDLHPQRPRIIG